MVLAVLLTNCVRKDPRQADVKSYTISVVATKALSIESGTLYASWDKGDAVTVYNVTRSADMGGSLTAQSSGSNTLLKGSLTGTIGKGDVLRLKFRSPSYTTQNGTLAYIAANCDYAVAEVEVTDDSTPNITTTDAAFANQQAIVKFILKEKITGNPAISASRLTVTVGGTTITVSPSGATDELFVAMPGISGQALTLSADVNPYIYTYEKAGVSFANSQYYEVTVKMTRHAVNLAAVTSAFTAVNGDVLTGTLGSNVQISIADGATVTLENARLAPSSYPGLTCLGNATINLAGSNTTNGGTFKPGIQIGGSGTTLTINGPGSLSATGSTQSAAIGLARSWDVNSSGGNLVINGGSIEAQATGTFGAGIGTGVCFGSSKTSAMGDITINGGSVTARGAEGGAGIGTGFNYNNNATTRVGNITVNGGTVAAYGGAAGSGNDRTGGAAIGNGENIYGANGHNIVGNITIGGGTVTAECGPLGTTVLGCTPNGTCGDVTLGGASTTPTVTLINPHNSGSSVLATSFMNPGSGQHVYLSGMGGFENVTFTTFDGYSGATSDSRFGCFSVNEFRLAPDGN